MSNKTTFIYVGVSQIIDSVLLNSNEIIIRNVKLFFNKKNVNSGY